MVNKIRKIINITIKKNWILILIFFILSLAISIQALSLLDSNKNVDLNKIPFYNAVEFKNNDTSNVFGINQLLNIFFGIPSIIFFSIFYIILINVNLLNEITNKKMIFYLSSPVSRKKQYFSKFYGMFFETMIIYIPFFFIFLLIVVTNQDLNFTIIIKFFLLVLNSLIFLKAFLSIISFIFIKFINKQMIINFIVAFVILIILAINILDIISKLNNINNLYFIKYLDISNLIVDQFPVKFHDFSTGIWWKENDAYFNCDIKNTNYYLYVISLVFCILVIVGFQYLNIKKYKNTDFYI